MKKLGPFILLLMVSCAHESAELFDREYASLCEAFTDISKYARSIHINAYQRDYNDIRNQAVQSVAKKMDYSQPLPENKNCADIDALAGAKVSKKEVYDEVLQAYMSSLDPHSLYFKKDRVEEIELDQKNMEFGTGIEFRYIHRAVKLTQPIDHLIVDYVYPNTDAYEILKRDDEVETINGVEVKGKKITEIGEIVSKDPNSVKIKVTRLDQEISVTPKLFRRTAYYSSPIESSNGQYVMLRVPRIFEGLTKSLQQFLVEKKNSDGILMDLRGNRGGPIEEALGVVQLFVSGKEDAFYTDRGTERPRNDLSREKYKLSGQAIYSNPVVVLVDSDTASSAEIIASVLQQKSRAIVLGGKTFGKASMQFHRKISEKSGFGGFLITTVGLIYYPGQKTHQVFGVNPDYALMDEKYDDALNILHDEGIRMILREEDYPNPIQPVSGSSFTGGSSLSASLGIENLSQEADFSHTCENVAYEACLENYGVQFLSRMSNK